MTWLDEAEGFVEYCIAASIVLHRGLHALALMFTALIEHSIVQGELDVWILVHSLTQ